VYAFWWSACDVWKTGMVQLTLSFGVVLLIAVKYRAELPLGDDNSVTGGVIGDTSLLLVNYLVVAFCTTIASLGIREAKTTYSSTRQLQTGAEHDITCRNRSSRAQTGIEPSAKWQRCARTGGR